VIFDAAGNLYGTTELGGVYEGGTVFQLIPAVGGGWTEKVLHNFTNSNKSGSHPWATLILDAAGNLYGTTAAGGGGTNCAFGCGTVFELLPGAGGAWTIKFLHNFNFKLADGSFPSARLIFDAAGNLYGTTFNGGFYGYGTVFELTPKADGSWTEKILHSFGNSVDGQNPAAGLTFDAAGNLYGTTSSGGTLGLGTVFELTPKAGGGWTSRILHNFGTSRTDGQIPYAGLIFDSAGNLYSTTVGGGAYGAGTVFNLSPKAGGGWAETLVHSFRNLADGAGPYAGVVFDASGNLYGATSRGGTNLKGTVFKLTPTAGSGWTETLLYSFFGESDGGDPLHDLTFDAVGNLYGTTRVGGLGGGTVFEIAP